jgi:L-rhamnose isomerase
MKTYQDKDGVEKACELAVARYASLGVDAGEAMAASAKVPVSLHCWQGDDVTGFERADGLSGGGILATGNYPGRARNADELRTNAALAFSLVPGTKRFNLHSIYTETAGKKIPRDELAPEHFTKWIA